jgi:hypothetical protein
MKQAGCQACGDDTEPATAVMGAAGSFLYRSLGYVQTGLTSLRRSHWSPTDQQVRARRSARAHPMGQERRTGREDQAGRTSQGLRRSCWARERAYSPSRCPGSYPQGRSRSGAPAPRLRSNTRAKLPMANDYTSGVSCDYLPFGWRVEQDQNSANEMIVPS